VLPDRANRTGSRAGIRGAIRSAALKVFISYRREDSAGYTGRLYDSLRARFGDHNVFLDVSGIDSGRKFAEVIQSAIHSCDVVLAVIGPGWLTCAANGRRRLDDPADLVRGEILTALTGAVPVIPVLVGGASPMTPAALPAALRPLAALDAHDMTDERWAYDTDRLIQAIEKLAGRKHAAGVPRQSIAVALLLMALLAGGFFAWRGRDEPDATASRAITAASVAGDWEAQVRYPWGTTSTERFSLKVDGGDVSGTASFLGVARGITAGTIEGDRLSFDTRTQEVTGDAQPRDVVHHYRGRLEARPNPETGPAGDAIAFTMQTEGGSSDVPAEFTATRR
jgi:hypothetical protein